MSAKERLELDVDVLVVGGGPSAVWAALAAKAGGARVALVDKGFCGSSGVTAAATTTHWWVPPEARDDEIARRDPRGGYLSERSWMQRVMEETWRRWPAVAESIGYPASAAAVFRGVQMTPGFRCQGPVYMREMRRRVSHSGVRILDHSPALELLVDAEGAVCGAAGVQRQKDRAWRINAGGVVLATGGCCWKSGALGSNVDTGDGHLMAAEAGARFTGMEFSNYYGIVAKGGSLDKNGLYGTATFSDADGNVIAYGGTGPDQVGSDRSWLFPAALDGPIYAMFDMAPVEARPMMRAETPNLFMALDRHGVDPFTQRFQVEHIMEGLTRGTGGVQVVDDTCWTGVRGLWAAGDAVSREALAGAASGAGSPDAAWTICSGSWAGEAAANHALSGAARADGAPPERGGVGLRPGATPLAAGAWRELTQATQAEILPPAKNGYRREAQLRASLRVLDDLWAHARQGLIGHDVREQLWARETAALIACARWAYRSGLARTESRGMHQRTDFPETDRALRKRLVIAGVDEPEVTWAVIADPATSEAEVVT